METLDASFVKAESRLVPAENGKRFANYIIDTLLVVGVYVGLMFIGIELDMGEVLYLDFGNMLLTFGYYVLMEAFSSGKTLGKMVTGTRVVMEDGEHPEVGTIALRTLSRFVPFEAFSFFGDKPGGWHDRWTKTMVIDEKLSEGF